MSLEISHTGCCLEVVGQPKYSMAKGKSSRRGGRQSKEEEEKNRVLTQQGLRRAGAAAGPVAAPRPRSGGGRW